MNRDELRTLMADYLDGLLDEAGAREAEGWIAREPALFAQVAEVRARLYRPYAVPPLRPDQAEVIAARFRARPRLARLVRYAAVFLAGVLTALAVQSPAPERAPGASAKAELQPPPAPPIEVQRRILR